VRRNHLAVRPAYDQTLGAPQGGALALARVGEHQQRLTLLLPIGQAGFAGPTLQRKKS